MLIRNRSFFPIPAFDANNEGGGGGGQPWFTGKEGVTDEVAGYFSRRGWDKDPVAAALGAAQAHREAERKLGIPSEQLLRLPKEPGDPGWKDVHTRLGVPGKAEDYDLSNVKNGDKPLDEALATTIKATAHALNLPKDAAPKLAQAIVKLDTDRASAVSADTTAKLAEERTALDKNWGANKAANMQIAKNAALAFGMTPEEVTALENVAGYAKTMEMLRQIGIKTGEDKFIRDDSKPGGGVMSKQEAAARVAELKADRDWSQRYIKGGAAETREMMDLLKIITGAA